MNYKLHIFCGEIILLLAGNRNKNIYFYFSSSQRHSVAKEIRKLELVCQENMSKGSNFQDYWQQSLWGPLLRLLPCVPSFGHGKSNLRIWKGNRKKMLIENEFSSAIFFHNPFHQEELTAGPTEKHFFWCALRWFLLSLLPSPGL